MTYIVWAKTVEIFSKCLLWCSTKGSKAFTFKIKWGWINDEPGGSKRFDQNFLKTTAIVCSTTLFGQGTNGNHRSRNWPSIVFNVTHWPGLISLPESGWADPVMTCGTCIICQWPIYIGGLRKESSFTASQISFHKGSSDGTSIAPLYRPTRIVQPWDPFFLYDSCFSKPLKSRILQSQTKC